MDQDFKGTTQNKNISISRLVHTLFQFLLSDVILYSIAAPVGGTYLGGHCVHFLGLDSSIGTALVIICTVLVMHVMYCIFGEAQYWKHLFAFDSLYSTVLQVRDTVNIILFIGSVYRISTTVEYMVKDKGMKPDYVGEGVGYICIKWLLCDLLRLDSSYLVSLGLPPPYSNSMENAKYEHGATYMLYWAILASCIAKLLYFNTLFTYLRAMEIFVSMRPNFGDIDDSDDNTGNDSMENDLKLTENPTEIDERSSELQIK